jgi:anti-sigma regulatory factor (Ser/Thr protein kinase)
MTTPATGRTGPGETLMAASGNRPVAGPPAGSAWQPSWPGHPRPLEAGRLALAALPTSPFWARRYTRFFLDCCRGVSEDTAETAELLVSELVTNAIRFTGNPGQRQRQSGHADAGLIWLSIRLFRGGLLIEVYDADSNPPVRSEAGQDAEGGRGLAIIDALSKEWSYFLVPGGDGKVVYCFLETP